MRNAWDVCIFSSAMTARQPFSFSTILLTTGLLTCLGMGAEMDQAELSAKFKLATLSEDPAEIVRLGKELIPAFQKAGNLQAVSTMSLKTAFGADQVGTPEEAVATADAAIKAIAAAQENRMRPWDRMLQAQLAGMATKHLIRLGSLSLAWKHQDDAWGFLESAIKLETTRSWKRGQPIPRTVSESTLGVILRTARWDAQLLADVGRNVEAVENLKKLDRQVTESGLNGGIYRDQLLNLLTGELRFLGFWNAAMTTQSRILERCEPGTHGHSVAKFNRAYWRSQQEGPDPTLLAEARTSAESIRATSSIQAGRQIRRLLAKMAFAYREAGFEIGDLADIVAEAEKDGDRMEAIYARRDMAVIQRDTQDFAKAEANLLQTLGELRATGRKSGEPTAYREYGILLRDTGRPRDAMRMLNEAIRLTKSFHWTQHLPRLLHSFAQAAHAADDVAALNATLTELNAILASGVLEPDRKLDASVAISFCLQALGKSKEAAAILAKATEKAKRDGVSNWMIEWAAKFPLEQTKPIKSDTVAATSPITDLQPIAIHSSVTAEETALARFTLSNVSSSSVSGKLIIRGKHLSATWNDARAEANLTVLTNGGETELVHTLHLHGNEEFQLIGNSVPSAAEKISVNWQPATGKEQKAEWTISLDPSDGADVAVTNASLAGKNAFYAVRLHHALSRRSGPGTAPVDFRIVASQPVRIEILSTETGELLGVDANGDGKLDGKGDLNLTDTNHNSHPDLPCPTGRNTEVAVLIYPLTDSKTSSTELALDVQILNGETWETAARDLLK